MQVVWLLGLFTFRLQLVGDGFVDRLISMVPSSCSSKKKIELFGILGALLEDGVFVT
jgi:hypothetical protein